MSETGGRTDTDAVDGSSVEGTMSAPQRCDVGCFTSIASDDGEHHMLPGLGPRFRWIQVLGCGGMGEVHLAEDRQLGRRVAIKRIVVTSPAVARHDVREAWLTAQITHPNVVTVYDVRVVAGSVYLISEYIDGESLDRMDQPLPWRQVLEVGGDVARALAAAHLRDVLHRDIKPGNVILERGTGRAKLIDFGVAKLVRPEVTGADERPRTHEYMSGRHATGRDSDAACPDTTRGLGDDDVTHALRSETSMGARPGTPRYQAPELWDGEPASPRTDVYAVGALLYQLCTGTKPPLLADPSAREPIRVERREVDPRFAYIVHRCLEFDPSRRYGNADELFEALSVLSAAPVESANPYRGLLSFQERHRELFFGRDSDVRRITAQVRDKPFVLLVGESGVGKSSLALAGVLPRLRDDGLGTARRWEVHSMVPGRHPLSSFARVLVYAGTSSVEGLGEDATEPAAAWPPVLASTASVEEIVAQIRDGRYEAVVHSLCNRLVAERVGVVLFIDQLEELFTVGDPGEAESMQQLLAFLIEQRFQCVRVVAAVRADHLAELADTSALGPLLQDHIHLVRSLDADGIRSAIVEPARATGVCFESEALVQQIVNSTMHARGGMPLLQFSLAELWEARDPARSMITQQSLVRVGGVAGALAQYADEVLDSLTPEKQHAARHILLKLVVLHRRASARRTQDDLVGENPLGREVLELMVRRRLVVSYGEPLMDGTLSYSIAHEALLTAWPRLRRWLDRERDLTEVKDHLAESTQRWLSLGRPKDEGLWGERALREVERVAPAALSATEAAFVAVSRRALLRARWRKRSLFLVMVAIIGAAYAGVRYQARRALADSVAVRQDGAMNWLMFAETLRAEYDIARERTTTKLRADEDGWGPSWSEALALDPRVLDAYRKATRTAEAAFLLDPTREDVKALLARAIDARASFAEVTGRHEVRDELVSRLSALDPTRGAEWREFVPVWLSTEPEGATVDVLRYIQHADAEFETKSVVGGVVVPAEVALAPGSYLIVVRATEGRAEVRLPLLVRSQRTGDGVDDAVRVFRPRQVDIPEGFVYVPPGSFTVGYGQRPDEEAIRRWHETPPGYPRHQDAFLIGMYEVTYREWLLYMESCAERQCDGAKEASAGIHIESDGMVLDLERTAARGWQIHWRPDPELAGYRAAAGEPLVYAARKRRRRHDWLDLPVSGVSPAQARGYLAWLREVRGVAGADLCTDAQWERAARGADERLFPHGNGLRPNDANTDVTYGRVQGAYGPDRVGSHPRSVSPFGVHDMAGNVAEMVRPNIDAPADRLSTKARGGSFFYSDVDSRVFNQWPVSPGTGSPQVGFRVCADAPIGPAVVRMMTQ
ncbi:protein kinase domain-containing protein [Haliangium sp.]|uniref:nSTAND1 domain-containing NTPase n=1 Tax=Haliangium sp. TaxID=2663208 RepID=UPI003D109BFF